MVERPRLLDLFCGAGGAAMGYHRAGFDVVGVDIEPQPRYPFEFIQADALEYLACVHPQTGMAGAPHFDAIHASPPCQDYSKALRHMSAPQERLIDPVRDLLEATGLPWVIENVNGAPLPRATTLDGRNGMELCGTMFGLRVGWHRLFETSFPVAQPSTSCRCDSTYVLNPHNVAGRKRMYAEFGAGDPEAVWRRERDTAWMGRYEAREAIPPAYTAFIGRQLLDFLGERDLCVGDGGDASLDVADDLIDGRVAVVGELDVEMDEDRAGHGGLLSVDASDSPKPASDVKEAAA